MSYDTYIINLKQDTDKYERMQQRLDNLNIQYTRFNAVYGKHIGNEYDDLIINKPILPRSAIGCSLSHYLVCKQHFNNDKNKIALILEDDAVPLFKNKKTIDNIIDDAPKDWEIILLYTQGATNYKDNTWECTNISGSAIAYLINYNGFKKRYDNYKVTHLPDLERCFINCNIYKTPNMYFKPEFSESSTSSKNKNYMTPIYSFLDNLYYDELETDVTGFSGSMAGCYKLIRIPFLGCEFDFLEILFTIIIFFSLLAIVLSKKKFNTLLDSVIYGFVFFALVLACVKILIHIIN
tara:strand:- start:1693 stop:2574 length:882 start_codon:yes stop_codon:yes gene_type:complete